MAGGAATAALASASPSASSSAAAAEYSYPFATAPDVIRSNQKDAYFQAVLCEQLASVLRTARGARFVNTYTAETRSAADIIYLALTTLVGNRTLGEEYCDIVQVQGGDGRLPSVQRRAGYIAASVLLPYGIKRAMPAVRRRVRATLEGRLAHDGDSKSPSQVARVQQYILDNLETMTSPAPIYAISLATFYFTGAYYQLSKRIFDLRYIFTTTTVSAEHRAGYEVLGVLLILQLSVQAYLHVDSTLNSKEKPQLAVPEALAGSHATLPGERDVSLDLNHYSSNNALLLSTEHTTELSSTQRRLANMTHTPPAAEPRIDLGNKQLMQWLQGRQARKCTLCLEPMRDPSATPCGHLFCWTCIADWVREKPECPLCRQSCLVQHLLPLRE